MSEKSEAEAIGREIRRRTQRRYSAEEKIRIVLEGLRGRIDRGEPFKWFAPYVDGPATS